tara:strand:- start:4185 stop:5153 length:969 start_codon:yes stop_codon:yes gene_type:complete
MALTKTNIINLALNKLASERLTLTSDEITANTLSHAKTVNLHYEQTLQELVRMHKWNCCKARAQLGAFKINIAIGSNLQSDGAFTGDLTASSTDSNGFPVYTSVETTATAEGYAKVERAVTGAGAKVWQVSLGLGSSTTTSTLENTNYSPTGDYAGGSTADTGFGLTISIVKPAFEYSYQHRLPTDFIRTTYVTDTSEVYLYGKSKVYYSIEGSALLSNEEDIFLCYVKEPDPSAMDSLFGQAFVTLLAARMAVPITGDMSVYKLLLEEFNSVIMPEARRINGFEKQDSPEVDSEFLEATYTSGSSVSNSYPPFSQTSYGTF